VQLHAAVDSATGTTKVNVNRQRLWEGARRAFLRPGFCPANAVSVKFTDDIGLSEGAVDQGGPRREFFTLMLDHLRSSAMFIGPPFEKHLNLDSRGL